ncbi:MAG: OmpA family protein [Syntrophaceae bacterium]|nr:OmpA family protein [Syntrophaceae bacterium]
MNIHFSPRELKFVFLGIIVGTVLTGCGTIDPSEQIAKDRLEQARASYTQAKDNPIVESYSLKTLQEAEQNLKEAEQVREKVYSPDPHNPKGYDAREKKLFFIDIARLSYMSTRKSQTSEALAEGVVTQNELLKLGKEKAEVQLQKSQLEKKLLMKDLADKDSALMRAKEQLAQATSEADRARILADIKAKEAEKAKAELALLMAELSELQGQLTERGIVLTIGDILFAFDKDNLNASGLKSMDKIAAFLRERPNRKLLVEGHTDNIGTFEYNQGLSERRAASVKNALVERGVAGDRIVTIGYSKKYPIASNDTPAGRQQNRRVEVVILNEGVDPETQFRKDDQN